MGYLTVWINGLKKKDAWFDVNQEVVKECFEDLTKISISNTNWKKDAWKGTIIVKEYGIEVPLYCAGCGGDPFDKDIVVDANGDGADKAPTNCLNGRVCDLILPWK